MTPVTPISPVAPWLGGKRNLARLICARLDATPHATYAEPFVGMGGIFLRRVLRPRAEVIAASILVMQSNPCRPGAAA